MIIATMIMMIISYQSNNNNHGQHNSLSIAQISDIDQPWHEVICEPDVLVRTLAPEDWALVMLCSKATVGPRWRWQVSLVARSGETYMVNDG